MEPCTKCRLAFFPASSKQSWWQMRGLNNIIKAQIMYWIFLIYTWMNQLKLTVNIFCLSSPECVYGCNHGYFYSDSHAKEIRYLILAYFSEISLTWKYRGRRTSSFLDDLILLCTSMRRRNVLHRNLIRTYIVVV